MKILWVKAEKLLPVETGGRIRSYNILRQLVTQHEVTCLSYYGGQRDETYEDEMRHHFPGAVTLYTRAPDTASLKGKIDYLRHLPSVAPYAVVKFTHPPVQRILKSWVGSRRFDVAVCDFLSASLNFPDVLPTPTVLFQHNVESVLWRRQADQEPNPLRRMAFKLEAAKMERYERAALRRFHHIIAVSEQDRDRMGMMTDPGRITVVPTGVDLQHYRLPAGPCSTARLVMFIGSMDWTANIDAVEFFCRDIWPRIRARVPDARLRIVGRNPDPRVLALRSDSLEVTGTVASVIEHLKEAAVVVVPLRIGGGTRLKIYEAMAMGKAVVSTSIGAEGLNVHPGRDVLLADDGPTFADCVTTLLQDEELRGRYGKAAAELACQHDWSVVVGRFADVLDRVSRLIPTARQTVTVTPSLGSVNI